MGTSRSSLLADVEKAIAQIDRLNHAADIDLSAHAGPLETLKSHVAERFGEMRDEFVTETDGADADEFLESLQNLFEMYLGDDVVEKILQTCAAARTNGALADRIHSELMRHVARLALT